MDYVVGGLSLVEHEDILYEDVWDAEGSRGQGSVQGEAEGFAVEGDGTADRLGGLLVLVVFANGWVLHRLWLSVDALETTIVELSTGDLADLVEARARDLNSLPLLTCADSLSSLLHVWDVQ